jgi:hypothetical protein
MSATAPVSPLYAADLNGELSIDALNHARTTTESKRLALIKCAHCEIIRANPRSYWRVAA